VNCQRGRVVNKVIQAPVSDDIARTLCRAIALPLERVRHGSAPSSDTVWGSLSYLCASGTSVVVFLRPINQERHSTTLPPVHAVFRALVSKT
jgi:hypothetical protein